MYVSTIMILYTFGGVVFGAGWVCERLLDLRLIPCVFHNKRGEHLESGLGLDVV